MFDEDSETLKLLKTVFKLNQVEPRRFCITDVFPRKVHNRAKEFMSEVRVLTDFPLLVDFYIREHIPSLLKWGAEIAAVIFGDEAKAIFRMMCDVFGTEIEWRNKQIKYGEVTI